MPFDIVWRKNKFGFEAPVNIWLNDIKEDILNSLKDSYIISHILELGKISNLDRLDLNQQWKLFNLAKWEKLYNVSMN